MWKYNVLLHLPPSPLHQITFPNLPVLRHPERLDLKGRKLRLPPHPRELQINICCYFHPVRLHAPQHEPRAVLGPLECRNKHIRPVHRKKTAALGQRPRVVCLQHGDGRIQKLLRAPHDAGGLPAARVRQQHIVEILDTLVHEFHLIVPVAIVVGIRGAARHGQPQLTVLDIIAVF